MLFDERPKEERRDLFGRDKELEELKDAAKRPLVLLLGIRRIGKTSLLRVALKELKRPTLLLDARNLGENYGKRELYSCLASSLQPLLPRLERVLKAVKGVRILGAEVELRWKGEEVFSLSELFDRLNREGAVIAIDEAQKLRGPLSPEIKNAIAHAYDYDRNLTFILTGSEVGLLRDFLGIEDESSPLYGRYAHEVVLERFDREKSLEFLRRGFEEAGRRVEEEVLERAVEELDGIPGWLTFFGNSYLSGRTDLPSIKRKAVGLAVEELRHLLKGRPRRYALVLKGIAGGRKSWSEVKRYVEEKEGCTLSPSILHNVLENLEKMGILKDYTFLDPIYREAARLLT